MHVIGCTSDKDSSASNGSLPTLADGAVLRPDSPHLLEIGTHCGVGALGPLVNGVEWRTDEAAAATDWIPPEWARLSKPGDQLLSIKGVLFADGSSLTASANGRSVEYRPTTDTNPEVLCA